jgi:peptidoglycan/LPS O-acetylase OafA/YrhL
MKNAELHSRQRLRGLDALRGIAAMSVVLFHFTIGYEAQFGAYPSRPWFYAPNGHFGVELFFCISGFVILGTLERTSDLKRFAIARFARLYPAYIVCATLTLFAIALSHMYRPDLTSGAIGMNATMLAFLVGAPRIDWSYWTLTHEILFYAGAALLWFVVRPRRRLELPCLVWLGCSLIGHLASSVHQHHRFATFLSVYYANFFVLGMMLYYLSQESRSRLTIPTLCAALLMALFPPEFNKGQLPQPEYVLLIATFCTLILFVADERKKFLDFRPLVFLGEISYSLYLVHQVIGYAIIGALLRAGMGTNAAILIAISFVIGLAFCIRTFVEKPAERWIKNFANSAGHAVLKPRFARAAGGL